MIFHHFSAYVVLADKEILHDLNSSLQNIEHVEMGATMFMNVLMLMLIFKKRFKITVTAKITYTKSHNINYESDVAVSIRRV